MFEDPRRYFQTFTNTVNSCRLMANRNLEGPQVIHSWEHWQLITIELNCTFFSGERLEVFEGYSRKNLRRAPLRNLDYQFMRPNGATIFRIDTHGADIRPDQACHLHLDDEPNTIDDGDARLNGFSLIDVDFLTVFATVFDHLEGRRFPWEQDG